MTKKSRHKFEYFENEKKLRNKKHFFPHFKRLPLKQIKKLFLESKSPTLSQVWFATSTSKTALDIYPITPIKGGAPLSKDIKNLGNFSRKKYGGKERIRLFLLPYF